MRASTHVAIAASAALLAPVTPAGVLPWGATLLGALAPDIDGGGKIAYGSNFLPKFVPRRIGRLVDAVGVGASAGIKHALGHRGPLHWPIWGVMMLLVGYGLSNELLFWFGFGYIAHIAGDMCTRAGIPLLAPASAENVSLLPLKTGSTAERLLEWALWGAVAYLAIARLGYGDELRRVLEWIKGG
jgi:membrane-bound metal-dependent hydrolase YbcI (DUF457 family)